MPDGPDKARPAEFDLYDQIHDAADPRLSQVYDRRQILQWLIFLRVVVATFIFWAVLVLGFEEIRFAFYTLVASYVLAGLLSAVLIQRFGETTWFLAAQVYWDILFVTVLAYVSGGYYSIFLFMYVLSAVYASTVLDRTATLLGAAACIALLSGLIVVQFSGLIPFPNVGPGKMFTLRDAVNKIAFNSFLIIIAAMLSSFVSERSKSVSAELKRRRQDLEELRFRFEHMIRSVPIGLVALDDKGAVLFANPAAGRIVDRRPQELVGADIRAVIPGLPERPSADTARPVEVRFDRGDDMAYLSVGYSTLFNAEGKSIGSLASIEDLTEIRAMEEAVKRSDRLAAVGQLAAGIAHEIRNPLASMSGSIQVLAGELALDSTNRQLMDIVMREVERVNALVSDFLAFARPAPNNECLVDARTIVEDVVAMIAGQPACRDDRVRVRTHLGERLYLRADPKNLRQVLWNLAINAVHAMPEGGDLNIAARVCDESANGFDGKTVEIVVEDSGDGISDETMKSIFDPFFTTKEHGTGLGLTMCHNLVEMSRGRILVESRLKHGSRFTVLLPAAERAGAMAPKEEIP
ncbi:MAG: ATP-binding protein [Deltaproteobacteria bacterium]|nr:ATP-binding protein [Deltaproteobacteria bacterium]